MRAVAAGLLALTMAGCGLRIADPIADSDRVLVEQFFAASRLRDLTALRNYSTVVFEPATDGIVTSFEIMSVTTVKGSDLKDVWLSAPVRLADGRTVVKYFGVTIQGGLVTAISERPASPSTPRS